MASSLESTLTRAWLRRGPLAIALWPLSLLFRLLASLRAGLFRAGVLQSGRLPVPVIVVGNIFIGGTGKTPLTIWLVEQLRAAGLRPGVISRGHGGEGDSGPREVLPESSAREVGDEPLLIAHRTGCPVVVGRRRVDAGRYLLERHPEVNVVVTDDGLQHYALQRDVELVLFDGRGVGNGWTLPAGPLREPPSRRRDFTVVNTPELTPALARAVGGRPYRMQLAGEYAAPLRDAQQRVPLSSLATTMAGKRIVAAAGIGNPGRFFAMLKAAGLAVQELPLPDHHDFLDDPFRGLDADLILITEKDAVKCRQLEHLNNDPRLWVVPVTAQLDAVLAAQIVEKCRGRPTA
ncbi:tetraacyldisaccharide 4'-kinase [Massilia norwichensis]|uniref:Tetraacyldisaccharide 4'-kinase n=1 Tax=Massilia norwichensis TaxID=1442366 RepID=A0ABT2A5B6_9BURK|nr:tetraacyldisaccharide 4'-kinase [Massilia norwichensis]MCS0589302.1 tetraacyldisaccharide 4'-kinase [Massilia norwichensis]